MSLAPQIEARKHSEKTPPHKEQQSSAQIEAAARLQIFLDRSSFSPGKIDGRYNEFTWQVLMETVRGCERLRLYAILPASTDRLKSSATNRLFSRFGNFVPLFP